jgi:hypothetical protein
MLKSRIRAAVTQDGDIEAAVVIDGRVQRVVVYRQGGGCKESTVPSGSDIYRQLVRAAREHCAV